ncbi:unnamed protein product [Bemisia tabaci]|uniref:Uncharacterized protein n=1 Tax=Bemisia tabaci TaxID=7038 RepID=A0A9P0A9N5_BEMTA|nr:unnamed protein product [Bemisia tabaci]
MGSIGNDQPATGKIIVVANRLPFVLKRNEAGKLIRIARDAPRTLLTLGKSFKPSFGEWESSTKPSL